MKKFLSLFCALITLLCSFTMAVYADVGDNDFTERESNDTFETADVIGNDYTVLGVVSGPLDMDYFKFTLTADSKISLISSCKSNTLLIGIYDSADNLITVGLPSYRNGYYNSTIDETLQSGTYYILVLQDSTYSSLSYAFYLEYEEESHTHKYSKIVTNPTCDTGGYTTYTCACGDSYKSDYTSALGHEIVTVAGVDPTCLQTGLTNGTYCQVCNVVFEAQETIPTTAHTWSEWEIITQPVLGEQGLQRRYCTVCGTVDEATIDSSTEHDYVSTIVMATTDTDGYKNYECQICGDTYIETISRIFSVKLSSSNVTYNGKIRTPSVSVIDADGVKLVKDLDYIVEYDEEMKMPGVYTVTVYFIGNYDGEENLKFTIAPKATTGVKAKTQTTSSITLTWSKTTGATGYRVYQYSPSKGKYVVKASVKDVTTYKVSGLKAGTTYEFKIKPYVKTDDGTVIWGENSSVCTVKTNTANSVNITSDSATIYVGGSKALKATVTPEDKNITWKSSDTTVAKVSSTGKVTALKKGTATITAYYKYNGKTYKDTCKITVKNPSISLSKTKATLYMQDKITLKATTKPSDLTVKWTSSNTKIAKVSSSGKVTPIKPGKVDITASFVYGGKTYKSVCTITVKQTTSIESNITNLVNYVKKNGSSATGGYKFIQKEIYKSGVDFTFSILYDHVKDCLTFHTSVESDDKEGLDIVLMLELNRSGTSVYCLSEICNSYDWEAMTSDTINPSNYINQYSIFEYWDYNNFPKELDEDVENMLYSLVDASMTFWDGMVKDAIGVGLSDIGFSNYNG